MSLFACLYARTPVVPSALIAVAESFTPRFEVVGALILLDISGLARLFGTAEEIGARLHEAAGRAFTRPETGAVRTQEPAVHVGIARTQTTAALMALGQPGLTVVADGEPAARLAALPVTILSELDRVERELRERMHESQRAAPQSGPPPAAVQGLGTVQGQGTLGSGTGAGRPAGPDAGGWQHPRATHQASQARRLRRGAGRGTAAADESMVQDRLDVLRRWGIHTLGALAALPADDVAERLGQPGVRWQRLAVGQDDRPLVPWVPDEIFEATLELEWPIEGLEPLSFVLARLFEPLIARLERADRGATILQTTLHLVTRTTYVRTLQLPAPMRDPKALRTLVLLDLESHPPSAAVDRVQMLIEPTPARILQWELFTKAQPSPEQVSTLLARLTALAGEGHVGSPRLVDSWKPGAFEMAAFTVTGHTSGRPSEARTPPSAHPLQSALRRFRIPVPARVTVRDGRPVRVQSDRHGVTSGAVLQAAGPWRTSGDWWEQHIAHPPGTSHHGPPSGPWDRDEWDVELAGGIVYRIFVEREAGQWFIEGAVD